MQVTGAAEVSQDVGEMGEEEAAEVDIFLVGADYVRGACVGVVVDVGVCRQRRAWFFVVSHGFARGLEVTVLLYVSQRGASLGACLTSK